MTNPYTPGTPGSMVSVLSVKEKSALEELQVNAREGALYFLSTCSIHDMAYSNFTEGTGLAKELYSGGKDIAQAVKQGAQSFRQQIEDGVGGYLTDMAGQFVPSFGQDVVAPALNATKSFVNSILPQFVSELTPYLSDAKQAGAGIYKSGVSFWNNIQLKRADYLARLNQGYAAAIAQGIYDQLFLEGLAGLKDLAVGAAKIAANAATAGAAAAVTKIVDLIAGLLLAVYRFFKRCIERLQLEKIFRSAGELRRDGLARHPAAFNELFRKWIKDLPILSCYCMNMKITGGYTGLLSFASANGALLSQVEFDTGLSTLQRLKNNSARFIRNYEVEIHSRDAMVTALMEKAAREDIDDNIASGALFGFYQKKWILEQKFKGSRAGKAVHSAQELISGKKQALESAAKARFASLWHAVSKG